MSVPFIDLKRDIALHRDEYLSIAARVFDSGTFASGPEVKAFEEAFASYLGVKHAIGVSNGTMALYAAYLALGIGPGDEVIVPANTFIATAEAVMMTGAAPIFVDINEETHHLDIALLDRVVTPKTKAIAVVHLFGLMADVDAVKTWADPRGIAVVEDTAQAHGARLDGRHLAGTIGRVGCFSFYPTKNLGALGEGGAVVTNDDVIASTVRAIRTHGAETVMYKHDRFGSNLRMEAIQGGILALRLKRLDASILRRHQIADRYHEGLAGLPITLPPSASDRHVFHLYVIATDRRDALKEHLAKLNIGSAIHYPIAIPDQAVFASRNLAGTCPVATRDASRILSLPMFPEITDAEVDDVIRGVKSFFAES
jgi:dTDP-4-amino-4,6-dideoxygalactose transaminase